MLIDRNDYTNSELEEMGLPLDDFMDDDFMDDDFVEDDFDTFFPDEWLDHDILFGRYFA